MDCLYWSWLPGLPKKMKWVVKVVEWKKEDMVTVYCNSDNAHFCVGRAQLIPFAPGSSRSDDISDKCIDALKKKIKTLNAFRTDLEWALQERIACSRNPKKRKNKDKNDMQCNKSSSRKKAKTFKTKSQEANKESDVEEMTEPELKGKEAEKPVEPMHVHVVSTLEPSLSLTASPNQCSKPSPGTSSAFTTEIEYLVGNCHSSCESDQEANKEPDDDEDLVTTEPKILRNCYLTEANKESDVEEMTEPELKGKEAEKPVEPMHVVSTLEPSLSHTASPNQCSKPSPGTSSAFTTEIEYLVGNCHSSSESDEANKESDVEEMTEPELKGKEAEKPVEPMHVHVVSTLEPSLSLTASPNQCSKPSPGTSSAFTTEIEYLVGNCHSSCESDEETKEPNFVEEMTEFELTGKETEKPVEPTLVPSTPETLVSPESSPKQCSEPSSASPARSSALTESDYLVEDSQSSSGSELSEEYPILKKAKKTSYDKSFRKGSFLTSNEIETDINLPDVYVRKILSSNVSKFGKLKKHSSVWNQAHACKYCHKVVTNISKHLKKHKSEQEIKEIEIAGKALGKRHKQVSGMWSKIRNEGDHLNNMKVIKEEKGEIILGRRQIGRFDVSKYGPCPKCFIWIMLDKTMYRHQSSCCGQKESENVSKRELRITSLMLAGRINVNASDSLKSEVFPIMTNDKISEIAQNDKLIVSLGNMWMVKNIGNKLKRKYYTSSRMRTSARLLMNLRVETGQSELQMSDFLDPEYFDKVATAALKTASPNFDDIEDLQSPSTAIKLGYDIKRMTSSKLGIAIKNQQKEVRDRCCDFLKLIDMEWSLRVTKIAHVTLQVRKFNKDKPLPDPVDLEDITKSLKEEIKKIEPKMKTPDQNQFRRAVMLAETRLLIYNKRRAGEIECISVQQYVKRMRGVSNIDKAMRADLTELELKLLETQEVLETRGKFGRGVPVIIPKDTVKLLTFLSDASIRKSAGIRSENGYLFPNSSLGVLRSYDSLKSLCSELKLRKPEQITSVNLRKYTATISQVFDLSTQEQSWLTNHLGHSMDIHKIHYRQTSGTIERIDITKLMLMQEFNLTAKYAGRKLKEIDLQELCVDSDGKVVLSDDVDQDEVVRDVPQEEIFEEIDIEDDGYTPDTNDDEADVFTFDEETDIPIGSKKRKKINVNRQKWSDDEIKELKSLFKENLRTLVTPGISECKEAIEESKIKKGNLHKRNWETIKKKVWNIIQKKKNA